MQNYTDLLTLLTTLKSGVSQLFPGRYWVKAEIGQVSYQGSGHCYLELVQSNGRTVVAKTRAAIWKSRAALIVPYFQQVTGSTLKAGMEVLLRVQVSCSELYGITLSVDEIDPQFTLGEQELKRKQTIERLAKEGLMEKQKDLCLDRLPYRLAVISAQSAAGYGDFMNHIKDNGDGFVLIPELYQAAMQGESCAQSIADAISEILSSGIRYDAVLILRGGGSAQDLVCFDEYVMAAAIANCPIPVVTAIGHDRDFHIADMVAYDYVKTPTALADYFLSIYKVEDDNLLVLQRRINASLSGRIASMQSKFDAVVSRIRNVSLLKIERAVSQISLLESRIKSSDPRQILSRGYALATDSSGVVLKKAEGVRVGDNVSVRFSDGTLKCEVLENRINQENKPQ